MEPIHYFLYCFISHRGRQI